MRTLKIEEMELVSGAGGGGGGGGDVIILSGNHFLNDNTILSNNLNDNTVKVTVEDVLNPLKKVDIL